MKYILVLLLVLSGYGLRAQDDFQKYRISVGAGYPNPSQFGNLLIKTKVFNSVLKLYENDSAFSMFGSGPFHLKFEYRAKWWLGVGLNINYVRYGCTFYGTAFDPNIGKVANKVTITYRNIATNCRANFYFINPENSDTRSELYLGIGLGYKAGKIGVSSEYKEYTPSITLGRVYNVGLETTLGYRYNFTENIAAYGEFGAAKSIVQGGLTVSF
jgi:hypothetical protein